MGRFLGKGEGEERGELMEQGGGLKCPRQRYDDGEKDEREAGP
jgi:hypothetical protein